MFDKRKLPEHLRYQWEHEQERRAELTKAGSDLEARKLAQESLESDTSINDVKANHEKKENTIQSGMKGPTPFNAPKTAKDEDITEEELEYIHQEELEKQNEQQNSQDINITLSPLSLLDDLAVALQSEQDISEMFSPEDLEMAQEALQENPGMIPNEQAIILAGVNFKEAIEAAGNNQGKNDIQENTQNGNDIQLEEGNAPGSNQADSSVEPETERTRPLPTPYDSMRR